MSTSEKNILENELRELAKKRVRKVRNFYIHLLIYLIATAFYVLQYFGIATNFSPLGPFPSYLLIIWTVIIVVEALTIFMTEVVFGKQWEARNIRKIIERMHENKFDNHGRYE